MKLKDLALPQQTKQTAKVFESYFGQNINFDVLSRPQVRNMLQRVRGLINEHKQNPAFHRSEQNPAYLKLVMLEQGLSSKLREEAMMPGVAPGVADPQQKALAAAQQQQKKRQIQDMIKAKQEELRELQSQLNSPMAMGESRRRIREASEIQQAQVVLASKDMVDQVQKMLEQVTALQFKDLPALVDQINNEVGQQQGAQFNNDASAALGGLVQNLQASKQQLEAALGVITGQSAPADDLGIGAVAGAEVGAEAAADTAGAELGAELGAEAGADDLEAPEALGGAALGRGRR
jgi:hypothetical protein